MLPELGFAQAIQNTAHPGDEQSVVGGVPAVRQLLRRRLGRLRVRTVVLAFADAPDEALLGQRVIVRFREGHEGVDVAP
jgi:hypothetical protein